MNEKKLQVYASLAEVVSGLAIIVSLLYAGYEFRRSHTMSSREADLLLYERLQEANQLIIETPGLAEILLEAATTPEDLPEADRIRLLAFHQDFFESWEIGWYYHEDGILNEVSWSDWDDYFAGEARRRPAFAWGEIRNHFAGESFRQHVDSVLSTRP